MDGIALLNIVVRWVHVASATLVVGGVFFLRVVLPSAVSRVDEGVRAEIMAGARRRFKAVVHTCILLLIVSGTYNSIRLFPQYNAAPGLLHGLWGMHILLALAAFAIAIVLLSGKKARGAGLLTTQVILLLVVIGVAAGVKGVREAKQAGRVQSTTAPAP